MFSVRNMIQKKKYREESDYCILKLRHGREEIAQVEKNQKKVLILLKTKTGTFNCITYLTNFEAKRARLQV